MDDPTAYLVEPADPDTSISNGFLNPIDIFNWVSPSAWVNSFIASVTGFDIIGHITQFISGDYNALWKYGDAVGSLADFMQALGQNVQLGAIQLDASWDGNAADAAYQYFSELAAGISDQTAALRNAQQSYHKAATGAWDLGNQLGNLVQVITDKAIIALTVLATSTAFVELGAGLVGYAAAAVMVKDIIELANKASSIMNYAATGIVGAFGAGIELTHRNGDLASMQLPNTAYTPPGV